MSGQPSRIESLKYLLRLMRCNAAIGYCLRVRIENAKDYEYASRALKDSTLWPADVRARAAKYRREFPWLEQLFLAGGGKCPVWEQFAEDLIACNRYQRWLYHRVRPFVHPNTKKAPKPGEPKTIEERVTLEFAYVHWNVVRQLIGKARGWAGASRGQDWLPIALKFCRAETGRGVREEHTGIRRAPTKEGADGGSPSRWKPRVFLQVDLLPADEESRINHEPASDADEQAVEILKRWERDGQVMTAVERLPSVQQAVVLLRIEEGCTWKQVAELMENSVYVVKQLYCLALVTLWDELDGVHQACETMVIH